MIKIRHSPIRCKRSITEDDGISMCFYRYYDVELEEGPPKKEAEKEYVMVSSKPHWNQTVVCGNFLRPTWCE